MDDNKDKQDVTKKAGILAKLKSIKHLNLIVALAAAAVCVLVYFTFFAGGGDEASADSSEDLESKIASVLSRIDGVGDCEVVITYDGEGEKENADKKDGGKPDEKKQTAQKKAGQDSDLALKGGKA